MIAEWVKSGVLLSLAAVLAADEWRGPQLEAQTPEPTAADRDPSSDRGTHVSYGLVIAYDQARDDLLAPIRWWGPAVGLRFELDVTGPRATHQVSLLPSLSFLDNRYDHPGYAAGIEFGYAYTRPLGKRQGEEGLSLGAALRWDLHNGLYESWDDEHLYWFNAYSLAPRLAWTHRPGAGGRLAVELELPVVAFVARPPPSRLGKTEPLTRLWFHVSEPHRDLHLTSFPDYLALRGGASYAMRLGAARLVVGYSLAVSSFDAPARVTTVSHRFHLSHRVRL